VFGYDTEVALTEHRLPPEPALLGMDYTNNIGLRMREDIGPKAEGERRVLLLGDSYTEAIEVPDEQRFYRLLDAALASRSREGVTWRIVNGGLRNANPSQYLLMLRRLLPLVEPDLVIVVLAGNDLEDDFSFERLYGYEFDAAGVPLRPEGRTRLWLFQKSWLLRRVYDALGGVAPELRERLWPPANPSIEVPPWQAFYCAATPETQDLFRVKTGPYLQQIAAMVGERGAALGVFMIHYLWAFGEPYYEERYPESFREAMKQAKCSEEGVARYNAFVEGQLADYGLPFHNTFERFRREKRERPARKLWNYYDYHFSPAGNQVIADEMLGFVERLIAGRRPS
jgi:lysophospholipase L1-like esterase